MSTGSGGGEESHAQQYRSPMRYAAGLCRQHQAKGEGEDYTHALAAKHLPRAFNSRPHQR